MSSGAVQRPISWSQFFVRGLCWGGLSQWVTSVLRGCVEVGFMEPTLSSGAVSRSVSWSQLCLQRLCRGRSHRVNSVFRGCVEVGLIESTLSSGALSRSVSWSQLCLQGLCRGRSHGVNSVFRVSVEVGLMESTLSAGALQMAPRWSVTLVSLSYDPTSFWSDHWHHEVLCWLVGCTMIWTRLQHANKVNLLQLIEAEISRYQWTCDITYFEGGFCFWVFFVVVFFVFGIRQSLLYGSCLAARSSVGRWYVPHAAVWHWCLL